MKPLDPVRPTAVNLPVQNDGSCVCSCGCFCGGPIGAYIKSDNRELSDDLARGPV